MGRSKFYLEEEGIIFRSYDAEPFDFIDVHEYISEVNFSISGSSAEPKSTRKGLRTHKVESYLSEMMVEMSCDIAPSPNIITIDIEALRRQGVSEEILKLLIDNDITEGKGPLSGIRIKRNTSIVLTDLDVELVLTPLDKTVYFFYLRHPEGVRFKDLCDYREELMDLYQSVTRSSELAEIERSIDALVDPLSNSINEKCSRIKRAFIRAFGEEIAKHYYIDGKSGGPRSIALDRSLVTWETLRP